MQEVISALRGTGQEVTLLLCRPEPGVLSEMDTSALVSQQPTNTSSVLFLFFVVFFYLYFAKVSLP